MALPITYANEISMNIYSVGIVGAGQMGNGIAQICAAAGHHVIICDLNNKTVENGLAAISSSCSHAVAKRKMTEAVREAVVGRIVGTTDLNTFAQADFIIEAATENLERKLRILKSVDPIAKAAAIIATNTSSISITKLAAAMTRPAQFLGLHFFNPVPAMGLVEIIRGMQSDDATVRAATTFARQLGKTPIAIKNSPGFAVNRLLIPMINEAVFVLQEGLASADEIDTGMKLGANHPIGPLALADLVGLDTCLAIMQVLYREFSDTKFRPAPLLVEMVDAGYLGRKVKRGFYQY